MPKISREERKKGLKDRHRQSYETRDSGSQGKGVLDFRKIDEEISFDKLFYSPEVGTNHIDIIPYIVKGEHHPQGVKPGYEDYLLDIWVHGWVGPSESTVLCLKKTFGKACPICEERAQLMKDYEENEEAIKQLKPKRRVFYNVLNLEVPEKKRKIQIFEVSHFFFEKELMEEAANGTDGITTFADIDEGKVIRFRASEEKFKGKPFFKFKSFAFEDREDEYDDSIIEEAYSLDDLLIVPSYEEVRNVYYGILDDAEDNSKNKKRQRDDDDDEDEKPRKSSKRSSKDEEEDEEEDEKPAKKTQKRSSKDEEEDEEEEEKPVKKSSKKPSKDEEEEDEDEKPKSKKKTSSKCPHGHKFGDDNDNKKECAKCDPDTWNACNEELESN